MSIPDKCLNKISDIAALILPVDILSLSICSEHANMREFDQYIFELAFT